jgi:hypothetical protein
MMNSNFQKIEEAAQVIGRDLALYSFVTQILWVMRVPFEQTVLQAKTNLTLRFFPMR